MTGFGSDAVGLMMAIAIDVLMAVALYLPMATGSLFIMPIGAMGVGAYTAAELALHNVSAVLAIVAGALAGGVISLLTGLVVVRLQSWSSAIASLAMVEVLQVFFQNFAPIGGSAGLLGVPLFTPMTATFVVTIVIVLFLVVVELNRPGDVLEAIRDDELAAESSGIRVRYVRLMTFAGSGVIAGLGGALSAGYLGFVDPATYGFTQLNNYLLAAVFGGSTTALGSLFGGAIVNLIPQFVSFAANNTLIVFSLLVVVIMLVRRQGLITRRMVKIVVGALGRWTRLDRLDLVVARGRTSRLPRYLARRTRYSTMSGTGIRKSYGGVQVLDDVEIEVSRGEVLGIIGANGAGKTTLVNVLTGVVRCDSGAVEVSGDDGSRTMRRFGPGGAVRAGIARTFQNGRLFPGLTIGEHVSLLRGKRGGDELALVGLADQAADRAASLSYGDQRLVEIARALVTEPSFLILDEPAAGMTREEARHVHDLVRRTSERGVGVIVIDHNVEFTSSVCDRMIAMDFGRVIANGTPHEVLADDAVIEAYLGRPGDTAVTAAADGLHSSPSEGRD
jgi:branched-chain amino acid transport system permease protein